VTQLKITNWNIEWMNDWFVGGDEVGWHPRPGGIHDLEGLARRVAGVIEEMDADILTVQEGPSSADEMRLFVEQHLGNAYDVWGPSRGGGAQRMFALTKRANTVLTDAGISSITEDHGVDLIDSWTVDIDADHELDDYQFTRAPLLLLIEGITPAPIRVLSLHTKSKYVHRGRRLWNNPDTREEYVKQALVARRRISAEGMRVREYLNLCFDQDPKARLIVTGDFNDGPGLDYFERLYLTHNVAGLVAGSPFDPTRMLRHAFVDRMKREDNWTIEFYDFIDARRRKALLDHIFISPELFWHGGQPTMSGKIEHEIFETHSDEDARTNRDKHASDHRPQSVVLDV
jgi:endonuclease/exonuclease/phosphatase family metal-dependent hydrolase